MSQLDRVLAESGLEGDDDLAVLLGPLASLADQPAPRPSAELAAVLAGVRRLAARPSRAARAARAAAGVGVAAALSVGGTGLAAAANTLPGALQERVSDFSRRYLPFDFPAPSPRHAEPAPPAGVVPDGGLPGGELRARTPEEPAASAPEEPASVPSRADRPASEPVRPDRPSAPAADVTGAPSRPRAVTPAEPSPGGPGDQPGAQPSDQPNDALTPASSAPSTLAATVPAPAPGLAPPSGSVRDTGEVETRTSVEPVETQAWFRQAQPPWGRHAGPSDSDGTDDPDDTIAAPTPPSVAPPGDDD